MTHGKGSLPSFCRFWEAVISIDTQQDSASSSTSVDWAGLLLGVTCLHDIAAAVSQVVRALSNHNRLGHCTLLAQRYMDISAYLTIDVRLYYCLQHCA